MQLRVDISDGDLDVIKIASHTLSISESDAITLFIEMGLGTLFDSAGILDDATLKSRQGIREGVMERFQNIITKENSDLLIKTLIKKFVNNE